jgi:hypothetical protein
VKQLLIDNPELNLEIEAKIRAKYAQEIDVVKVEEEEEK